VIGIHHTPTRSAKIERLRNVPLFAGCSDDQLTAIAQLADEVDVPAGRTIIRQGAHPHEFLVIAEGAAEVHCPVRGVQKLGPGDFVGELSLLSGGTRTATVVTTAPTHLLVFTDRAFLRIVEQVPGLSLKLMRSLAAYAVPMAQAAAA
jgi:CRP-like cAMP-binding protein